MKKALQISIAHTLFTIEEDAYIALDRYLTSVKNHFKNTEGKDEIIADIESRLAEQLLEAKQKVIALPTVEKILDVMGSVDDFDDEENAGKAHGEGKNEAEGDGMRKLYRNPDDKIIGGVCSGLALYSGIDVVWVRLAFILLTFAGGFSILLYIILWAIVPEAKSTAQKLEMSGTPVTLETLSEIGREKLEKLNKRHGGEIRRIVSLPFQLIEKFFRFLGRSVGPIARIIIGVLLLMASIAILMGVAIASGFFISDTALITRDIPLSTLMPNGLYFVMLGAVALVIMVPALFALLGAIGLLRRKNVIGAGVGFGFLGVWFIALLMAGFGGAQIASNYTEFERTSPLFKTVDATIPITGNFDKLQLGRGIDVTIIEDATVKLTATGRARDIEGLRTRVENGTLIIDRKPVDEPGFCLLCNTRTPPVTLYVPALTAVTADYSSEIISEQFPQKNSLTLTLGYGSHADVVVNAQSVKADLAYSSALDVSGTANALTADLSYSSRLDASRFTVADAVVTASHSSQAELDVSKTLNAQAEYSSEIIYSGTPVVTERAAYSSEIYSQQELDERETDRR